MILVVRPFLIVQLIRHFYLHLFNLRLVYLPSDVLHVHKKYKVEPCSQRLVLGAADGAGARVPRAVC